MDALISEDEVRDNLPESVKRELILGYRAKKEFARYRQEKLSGEVSSAPRASVNGLGRRVATIDADNATLLRLQHGYDCFHDPEFTPWLLRNHPEYRNEAPAPTRIVIP